jgi:hypothetical protein
MTQWFLAILTLLAWSAVAFVRRAVEDGRDTPDSQRERRRFGRPAHASGSASKANSIDIPDQRGGRLAS